MNQTSEKGDLLAEIEDLRNRLKEAEETLQAIRNGEVDALVTGGPAGEQVYTLKGANQPYRILIETMNEGALTLSAEGTILYCNSRFSEMVNHPIEKIMGHSFFQFVTSPERERISKLLGEGLSGQSKGEAFLESADGGFLPALFSLRSLDFEDRKLICMVVTDLSDQKKDQEKLRNYSKVLKQRNKDIEDFTFIASHDLQEPLRKIQVFSDLILDRYAVLLDETGRDYLKRLAASANRMQDLIQDVRAYSKLTNDPSFLKKVDLGEIVRDAVSDLEIMVKETEALIHIGELPILKGNPHLMRILFQNLLSNALKYRNEEKPLIEVSFRQTEEGFQILVGDNGIGFDEKYADQIFKPFKRLHKRNEYEGTGMGLAICRKIVERHGGMITARSTPGKGSTFTVQLPAKQR
jgi:PAS domain S-box-containing protein